MKSKLGQDVIDAFAMMSFFEDSRGYQPSVAECSEYIAMMQWDTDYAAHVCGLYKFYTGTQW
jgi:hypothetical protein